MGILLAGHSVKRRAWCHCSGRHSTATPFPAAAPGYLPIWLPTTPPTTAPPTVPTGLPPVSRAPPTAPIPAPAAVSTPRWDMPEQAVSPTVTRTTWSTNGPFENIRLVFISIPHVCKRHDSVCPAPPASGTGIVRVLARIFYTRNAGTCRSVSVQAAICAPQVDPSASTARYAVRPLGRIEHVFPCDWLRGIAAGCHQTPNGLLRGADSQRPREPFWSIRFF